MASGRIKTYQGKILRVGGKIATGDDCCCGMCSTCAAANLTATITVAGSCDAICAIGGTYSWAAFADMGSYCRWSANCTVGSSVFTLTLLHYKPTSSFPNKTYAYLGRCYSGGSLFYGGASGGSPKDVTTQVSCVSGQLVGTFTLEGRDTYPGCNLPAACEGCVATVVLT